MVWWGFISLCLCQARDNAHRIFYLEPDVSSKLTRSTGFCVDGRLHRDAPDARAVREVRETMVCSHYFVSTWTGYELLFVPLQKAANINIVLDDWGVEGVAHICNRSCLTTVCIVDWDCSRHCACFCMYRVLQWILHGGEARYQFSRSCGGGALQKMASPNVINTWLDRNFVLALGDLHTVRVLQRFFER